MYESFFGLRELPFELTSDPRFVLLTPKHREALSHLRYGIASRKGLTVLIGQAGTGKTTLVRTVIREFGASGDLVVHVTNPLLSRAEFVETLATAFRLSPDAARSKSAMLRELRELLEERRRANRVTALIIDEAHSLSAELIEEIRLLANIETDAEKLLPIVMAGQPELADRLNELELQQVKQRVSLRCVLPPLDVSETASYVATRITVAGGSPGAVFTREAVEAIFRYSAGVPRVISVLGDNALISGFAQNRKPVPRSVIDEVAADLDLDGAASGPSDALRFSSASESPSHPPGAAGSPLTGASDRSASSGDGDDAEPPRQMFGTIGRSAGSLFRGRRG